MSHVATVRRAVEALGLASYAMLAHDSGGFIARMVAADDPRVTGLVLGNTEVPGHTPWLVALLVLLARRAEGKLLLAMLESRAVRRSFLGFGGCFSDLEQLEGEFHEFFVAPLLTSPAVTRGQMRLATNLDFKVMARLPEIHGRIRCPSLLVWGAEDPFFPLARARAMLGQLAGGAELFAIAGGKLFVHEEHPRAFTNLVRPFLLACSG